jgi:hypothetical protein
MRDDVLEQSATKLAVHSLAVRIHAEGTNVKALTWHGKSDMRCESVPDPRIEHPRDAIIKVTACAICGSDLHLYNSDLHLYNGVIPTMKSGDVVGHDERKCQTRRLGPTRSASFRLRQLRGWPRPSARMPQ